jgi:trigger factor
MKSEFTDISACKKSFDIEIPQDIVDNEITSIARNFAKKAKVPGFRPGKAPVAVVKTRYRDEIVSEMVHHLLPRYFTEAAKGKDLNIVDAPQYEEIDYANGQPLKFKAIFEVYPELNIANYVGIPAQEASVEVPDADVDATLKKLQDDMSELTPVEEERLVQEGDFVDISFTGVPETPAGQEEAQPIMSDKATVEVGGQTTLKEFSENLFGTKVNEEKNFTVTYRDNYPEKRLAGRTVAYKVKVEAIKEKKVPDLNDEFAQGLGEYKTLDDLRSKVRQDMEKHKKEHANEELREKLLVWLEDNNTFEVPETLVERQIQTRMQRLVRDLARQGINPERLDVDWAKIREDQRDQSIRDVKGSLILDYIADKEKIEVSDLEVEEELDRIAKETERPREKVKEVLGRDSGMSRLRGQVQNKKTLDFLQERARIQPAPSKE